MESQDLLHSRVLLLGDELRDKQLDIRESLACSQTIPPPVFDCLQYTQKVGEGLVVPSGREIAVTWGGGGGGGGGVPNKES